MPDQPFGQRPASERVATYCDTCGQTDPHPKHHVYDEADQRFESHHHDCGAANSCEVCIASEGLTKGKRYDDLVKAVDTPKHAAALADALGADTPEA